jgi:rubrerythrin
VVTGDPASCGSGSCQAVYDVAVLPDHLEAAQNALAVNYHAMLRTEGVDPEQVEGVVELCAGESTTCPACQTTFVPEDIRDATCPECELYLGVPDP